MSDAHSAAATADAHGHAHAPGVHPDSHHIDSHVRTALIVFGALLVLTGLTVGASYLHLPHTLGIGLALAIATIKGGLVLAWFMHLISEKKLILSVLALTMAFFFVLLLVPIFTVEDVPHTGVLGHPPAAAPSSAPAPAHH